MKRIFTLLILCSFATVSFSQKNEVFTDQQESPRAATNSEIQNSIELGHRNVDTSNRGGGSAFCEDFSNGLDGNNPWGAWTVEDTGDGAIWHMATADSPAGQYSNPDEALQSTTADNGWVIFDCDAYNPGDPPYANVIGYLTSPVIDMSDLNHPMIDWQQNFRYCCWSPSPLSIEVTIDGGENWTKFAAHWDYVSSTNVGSPNPMNTTMDISCVAANQPAVQFRFGYGSINDFGHSHYYWGIDDVCLYDNVVSDDLEILQVMNGDIFNYWEYRVTPMEQRILADDGGLVAGTLFQNKGNTDQTNVVITIDILDDAMDVIHTYNSEAFDMPAYVNSEICPIYTDTMYFATGWEPSAAGTYYMRSTIAADQEDSMPDGNVMEKEIIYSDADYGHDDEGNYDVELGPGTTGGLFNPVGYGNWYHNPNEGSVAYGVTVAIGNSSDEGNEFSANLYRGADGSEYDPNSAGIEAESYWWLDGGFTGTTQYFPFEFEVEMDALHPYFAAILSEVESEFELTALGNANTDTDNSSLFYQRSGSGNYVWFGGQRNSSSVRLVFAEWVGVEQLGELNGIDLNQNMPNPANGNTIISYNLDQPTQVRFEIRDLQGRIMEVVNPGMMPTGQHQFELNISDYAAGLYTYTLITDENVRLTRRMTVR